MEQFTSEFLMVEKGGNVSIYCVRRIEEEVCYIFYWKDIIACLLYVNRDI